MTNGIAVPSVDTAQMKEIDHRMVVEQHRDLLQMTETAGHALAMMARELLDGDLEDRPIVVLTGRGNHGGGGLAAARYLLNWGAWVQIICAYPPDAHTGAAAHQLAALQAISAPLAWAEEGWELPPADLVIDAIIGYGLRSNPRGPARDLIQLANSSVAPILSLDTPSGVEPNDGRLFTPHIKAAATLTLALPKRGFRTAQAAAACGDLYLADMGVPPALYTGMGIETPNLFACNPIIRLHVVDGEIWIKEI